ncbi:hypothetical protein KP509_20G063400 [Ceratopteris richardii]|nr:hypothetical protein KP509_20G063400 [Ceratopteris richardii]
MCIHHCSIKFDLDRDPDVLSKLIQMYCRCGDVDSAYRMFSSTTLSRNVFVWNVMIRVYEHLGQYQMALHLFNQMLCEGVLPDNFTLIFILTACSHQAPPIEGRRIHVRIMSDVFKIDYLVMNALLNMYSKSRNLEDVRNIFINMFERNIVTWTVMVDALLQHGCREHALQFFGHMQMEGIFPDAVLFSKITTACSESETLFCGKQLHVSLKEMGCESDVFVRAALLNMYGNCGRLEDACEVFSQSFERNVVLWNSLISLHIQYGLDSDALHFFNCLLQESLLPDRVTYMHCLSGCANRADTFEGRKIHLLALNMGSHLDVMLGTSIVFMYGKCSYLEAAWQAFEQLHEHSTVSWNVVLGILAQHGECDKAFHTFGAMQKQGLIPDKGTFVHILSACLGSSALSEGEQFHSYIIEMGFESDVMVGIALMNLYNKCCSLNSALKMFEMMQEHNVMSWNTIVMAHVQCGKNREALQLFIKMLYNEVLPDSSTISITIDACVSESLIETASLLHMYAVECGFESDNVTGVSLLNMYGKLGSLEDACSVFKAFQTPDVLSWTALLTAYIFTGNSLEVLRLYHKMELKGLVAVKTTYVVVLDACADLLDLGTMEEILIRIMIKGLDLDATVATAIVSLYGKFGNLTAGRSIFNNVPERDVILWTAVITMYAQNGHGKEAACLFSEMQDYGLVPNSVTFINLLAACSHAGLVEEGHYFLASMIWEYGTSPLVEHYDCAIDLFGRAGLLDEAECLINRMPFSPRVVSFMALMAACRAQADLDRGARIARHLFCLDLENSVPYVIFSNIILNGRTDDI